MVNFADLKKKSSLDKLKQAVEASSKGEKSYVDDRFWKPKLDPAGNGFAVIRFLETPAVDGEDAPPYVRVWSHGFKGPGGWYIENSLTTLGRPDPVSEHNTMLWNSGVESNKKLASARKRKLNYISNILVISDPKNPENNGKLFLFKYGQKIFDKLAAKYSPEFEGEEKMNPFDFWKGANFKLKIRTVKEGTNSWPNYDMSEFDSTSALFDGDDDKIEKVWKSAYSLQEFLKPENFKSYDELKAKLNKVLGVGYAVTDTIDDREEPPQEVRSTPAKSLTAEDVSFEDDDDMAFFKRLSQE